MKIAITGTHSTGKTTLANSISKKFGIKYIRGDKAIDICKQNFPNTPINKLSVQDAFTLQKLMLESFNEALEYKGDCVTDAFQLTCIPYGIEYTGGKMTHLPGYNEFLQEVLDRSREFDKVFYLPPEIGLEDNNFRPQDKVLRMNIDKTIYSLLQDYKFRTLSGTVEARTRTAGFELGKIDPLWDNYIVFEGLPRSGKSSQIDQVRFNAKKRNAKLYVCERNENEYMEEFKRRRINNWYDNSPEMLSLHAESIKHDFRVNNIMDRLNDGYLVVADRQKYTTMSLFGALGVPRAELYRAVYDLPDPGKVIFLNTSPVISVVRSIQTEPDKPLKSDLDMQQKVRDVYLTLANEHKFHTLESNKNPHIVTDKINEIIFGDKQ